MPEVAARAVCSALLSCSESTVLLLSLLCTQSFLLDEDYGDREYEVDVDKDAYDSETQMASLKETELQECTKMQTSIIADSSKGSEGNAISFSEDVKAVDS
ncbi:hypothetical protein TREES_T100014984 [Tupaia chinensis]|uniref:Uncharacterized protein n=1 Tax=Tupaia chinensis TaxID=246437 RepID=L9KLX9_TUPCH|nr:hypothetical protein TREES_T100014984 [Tupaia chinensis]